MPCRAVLVVAVLLAACSGGDPAPTVPSTSTSTSMSTTTSSVTPIRCTRADIDEVMAGVGGGAWGDGYAYVPDDRDEIADELAARCGDSVEIERGPPIRPVGDP